MIGVYLDENLSEYVADALNSLNTTNKFHKH